MRVHISFRNAPEKYNKPEPTNDALEEAKKIPSYLPKLAVVWTEYEGLIETVDGLLPETGATLIQGHGPQEYWIESGIVVSVFQWMMSQQATIQVQQGQLKNIEKNDSSGGGTGIKKQHLLLHRTSRQRKADKEVNEMDSVS